MAAEKLYISYNEIHQAICDCVEKQQVYERFKPTLLIAIGSGGFIPGRMLRTFLKQECGRSLPIQTIGLVLYDDNAEGIDPLTANVRKTQWLNYTSSGSGCGTGVSLQGQNILIVDEVDDTRKTLHYAVEELSKDIEKQKAEYLAGKGPDDPEWKDARLGIFVVHNKLKSKTGTLPEALLEDAYFKCQDVPDNWIVYPWDALDISTHQALADARLSAASAGQPGKRKAEANAEAVEHVIADGGVKEARTTEA